MKLFLAIRLCLFKIIYQKVFLANNCWNWRPALICQFYLRSRNWLLLMQRSPLNSTGLHPKKAAISFRGCSHFMSAKFWFFLTSSLQCVKRPKNLTETKSKTSSSTKLFLIPIPGLFLAQIFFETGLDIIKKTRWDQYSNQHQNSDTAEEEIVRQTYEEEKQKVTLFATNKWKRLETKTKYFWAFSWCQFFSRLILWLFSCRGSSIPDLGHWVSGWAGATLEFRHKEWLLGLQTLQTFGQHDV